MATRGILSRPVNDNGILIIIGYVTGDASVDGGAGNRLWEGLIVVTSRDEVCNSFPFHHNQCRKSEIKGVHFNSNKIA